MRGGEDEEDEEDEESGGLAANKTRTPHRDVGNFPPAATVFDEINGPFFVHEHFKTMHTRKSTSEAHGSLHTSSTASQST